ncbi:hypothetical protein GCM10009556_066210 [Acrocarpospora pleiomorpha]|nr:serine protease [Acrocarpospora pleiomorpha]
MAERSRLRAALCEATLKLTSNVGEGTGFFVAPGRVLTSAHVIGQEGRILRSQVDATWAGRAVTLAVTRDDYRPAYEGGSDLALLHLPDGLEHPVICLNDSAEPGDELWTYGYPTGLFREGDSVSLRVEGPSVRSDGTRLLRASHGRASRGHSGSPALNWRTGCVCGVIRMSRLIEETPVIYMVTSADVLDSFPEVAKAQRSARVNRAWHRLMSDNQLREAGLRVPGAALTSYLRAIRGAAREHPYPLSLRDAPPLNVVYLRQQATAIDDESDVVTADEVLRHHRGAQIIGEPGAGKSSLLRHLTDRSASTWLDGESAPYVPIPIHASALLSRKPFNRALADGVMNELGAELSDGGLADLFSREPLPGVPWLVLVDGLDEVIGTRSRTRVLKAVDRNREDTPYLRFLVASRPVPELTHMPIATDDAPSFKIEPFTDDQLERFATLWFSALALPNPAESAARFVAELQRGRLRQIAHIPLQATMICVVYAADPRQRLPMSRAELYERFIERLFDKARVQGAARRQLREQAMPYGAEAEKAAERLLDELRSGMEELAHNRQFGHADPAMQAPPPTMPRESWAALVTETLQLVGLLVERRGRLVFIHHTIEEYLAACHVARTTRKPGRFRGHRPFFPQEKWPWSHLEVKLFLAAIWGQEGIDLRPALRRLLTRAHRQANAEFLAELVRQGVRLPEDLFAQTCAAFCAMLAIGANDRRWTDARDALIDLDPERAAEQFESIAVSPLADRWRRYQAATALARIDRARGILTLQRLIHDPHAFDVQLRAARVLHEHDPSMGRVALAFLAHNSDVPDEYRIDAASDLLGADRQVGVSLFAQLVRDHRLSDAARLRAARALIDAGYEELPDLMRRLTADTTVSAATRAECGAVLLMIDKWAGISILEELCLDALAPPDARLRAAKAINREEPGRGVPLLRSIAEDQNVAPDLRLATIDELMVVDPSTSVILTTMAADQALDYETRVAVAEAAAGWGSEIGAQAFDRIVGDDQLTGLQRRQAAEHAADHDVRMGLRCLARLVKDGKLKPATRLKAAESAARYDRQRGIALLTALCDDLTGRARLPALGALAKLDPARAKPILVGIAEDHTSAQAPGAALELATIDRKKAISLLDAICVDSNIEPAKRITAATTLSQIDRVQGSLSLAKLRRDPVVLSELERQDATRLPS